MKISIISTMDRHPWAGSEELWYLAAKTLRERGAEVTVVYPKRRGEAPQLDELSSLGVDVRSFGPQKGSLASQKSRVLGKIQKRSRFLAPAPAVSDLGDLVLVSQGAVADGLPWLRELAASQVPFVILCQANLDFWWPRPGESKELRDIYAQARACLFVSEDNLRLFRLQTGYTGKGEVVWNPLQPGTPGESLPWPASSSPLRLAMVGRVEPFSKGQDLMLEVLSLDKWRERDLVVSIFGKGPWKETMDFLIAERNLSKIRDGGFKSPEEIWSEHHALLLPSRHEGKSLAMLEAMWLGRPVIATNVAGAPEEVLEGETGFLASAATVELLDDAMERFWSQRDSLPQLGQRAAERLRERMPVEPGKVLADKLTEQLEVTQ